MECWEKARFLTNWHGDGWILRRIHHARKAGRSAASAEIRHQECVQCDHTAVWKLVNVGAIDARLAASQPPV